MKCDFSLSIGLNRMRSIRQPGMVVIYKTWCPVCSELKSTISSSREINYLSNYIVIMMLKDDSEPRDAAFAPDGSYIPRVFFLAPTGNILYDVINQGGDPRYRYFYTTEKELVFNMRRIKNLKKNFGSNLKWETNLEAGLQKILEKQKPGMMIFHKSWCGACRGLKPKFEASKDIEELSQDFVLISLADESQPKDDKYMPDGDYVPRILFLSPQGVLLVEVINEDGSDDYRYFYSDAESIARSMKTVLRRYSNR